MSSPRYFSAELQSAAVILDTLTEGALLIDRDTRVAWINRPLERLLGIDRDALHGSDADRFVRLHLTPQIADETCAAKITALLSGRHEVTDLTCTIRSSDGQEHPVLVSSSVMQDEPLRGVQLISLHPAEARIPAVRHGEQQAEDPATANEELHALTEELQALPESLSEGIGAIDTGARITFVNERMAEMLGYTVKEVVGKPFAQFLPEEDRGRLDEEKERRRAGVSEQMEYTFIRKDGSRIDTLLVTSPLYSSKGKYSGAIAGVLDITERKQAEKALREARDELECRVRERTAELNCPIPNLKPKLKSARGWRRHCWNRNIFSHRS